MSLSTPRVHIIGRKNSGKTTLVCELVEEFTRRGLKVATVKHTHHHHELDTPGKDSHQHREAGAAVVGILAPGMSALFIPHAEQSPAHDRYPLFESAMQMCDLLLVEGDSQADAVRLEVWRSAVSEIPYAASDAGIQAVITDDAAEVSCPVWSRTPLSDLADRLWNSVQQRQQAGESA